MIYLLGTNKKNICHFGYSQYFEDTNSTFYLFHFVNLWCVTKETVVFCTNRRIYQFKDPLQLKEKEQLKAPTTFRMPKPGLIAGETILNH